MFYILEHKEDGKFNQLGIVVADSIELAAAKIEMAITDSVKPPESAVAFATLENGYMLSEMPEITSSVSIPKPKSTAKLMYIATTPVGTRNSIMPRIVCVDGVSLSVQASGGHYCTPRHSHQGPWSELEVGFLVGAEYPKGWDFVENHASAFRNHDVSGIDTESLDFWPVYTVEVSVLKKFIEDHGGEK